MVSNGVYKGGGRPGKAPIQTSAMRKQLRIIKPMAASSVSSFITSSDPSQSSVSPDSPPLPPVPSVPVPDRGVGLSDPVQSAGRRKMLELVNRMHNTG